MPASRLGLHSAYSLLYGVRRPEEIMARAASYGARAVAVADRDNLYGLHSIVEAAREAGLRPILGANLGVTPVSAASASAASGAGGAESRAGRLAPGSAASFDEAARTAAASAPRAGSDRHRAADRLFAFVQDRAGFSRLCELLSLAKDAERDGGQFDPAAALADDAAGLALATASPALLSRLAGRVPCLYAAVTPWSAAAARTADKLGVPLAALDDAIFLDPGDREVHAVLRAMALGKTVGSLEPGDAAPDGSLFLPGPEFERRLRGWPGALANAERLAASCSFDSVFDGFVFPEYREPGAAAAELRSGRPAAESGASDAKKTPSAGAGAYAGVGPGPDGAAAGDQTPERDGPDGTAPDGGPAGAEGCPASGDPAGEPPAPRIGNQAAVRGPDGVASEGGPTGAARQDDSDAEGCPASGDPAGLLRARVIAGARRRYGELPDAIVDRIDYELGIIGRKGFSPYFLVMDDIVAMSRRTCGRGSGAASIVAYCLGITNVDPISYDLYFERFLTLSRPDPPDIDVDFAWDERHELMRRVIARFGPERCARVANHNFFRPSSAFRETAKAFGYADGEVSAMERRFFDLGEREAAADPPWDRVIALAARIKGLPRGLGTHCGGLVIAPGPIRRYAPVETSAEGFPLLAWEKDGAEAAGLVKLDLLGNRSLAVIRDALANLRAQGIDIDEALWRPADDPETVAALARGDSMGVFYIESPAMRQLQRKTGAGDFGHIVIHSSIIRPAANKLISEYVRRLKGAPWKPAHPRLAGILDETYGIVCYQEDVSKVAIALAGFSEDEADRLRKVISKKAGAAKLAEYRDRYMAGCRLNGVGEAVALETWSALLSFDGYSFCKPHSASYAMVSFQSAWLRVHYPAEFMAAVLSNQGGYYRAQAYVSEARRMGLGVEGPDVERSDWRYRGEGGAVVVGLMAVAGLSRSAADAIVAERRRGGPFGSREGFARRMGGLPGRPGRDDIVALVASGAFDSLADGGPRSTLARALLTAAQAPGLPASSSPRAQGGLFEAADGSPVLGSPTFSGGSAVRERGLAPTPIAAPALRRERELRDEFETLGFLRGGHPLSLWGGAVARLGRILAKDIPAHLGRQVVLAGWPVTQKEVLTAGGRSMDFVSFEDETALYETVLFPETYARFKRLLLDQRPLAVSGRVKDDQGALVVEVSGLRAL